MPVGLQAKRPLFQSNFNQNFNESAKGCETLQYATERTFFRDHSAVSTVQVDKRVQRYSQAPRRNAKAQKKRGNTQPLCFKRFYWRKDSGSDAHL